MKNAFVCLIVTMTVGLSGCSPSEQSAQQQQAADQFSQAYAHVANATSGYVNSKDFPGTLGEYQAQELDAAADAIKPALNVGTPAQQVTAALLLANVQATRAAANAEEASRQWTQQSEVATHMLVTLAGARTAQAMADAQNAADTSQLLDDLNRRLNAAKELANQHQRQIDTLQRQIDAMTAQRQQLLEQIAQARSKAQKLAAQSQSAEGQMRYDTYLQSAEASRQAAIDSAKVDELSSKIDMLSSAKNVAEANRTLAAARAKQLSQALGEVQSLNADLVHKAAEARQQAESAVAQLGKSVEQLAEQHMQQVVQPFDAARADLKAAIEVLEQARNKDRAQADLVDLAMATRRYELAQINGRYAAALASYRDLIGVLAEQAVSTFSDPISTTLRETAKLASERAEAIAGEASAAMSEARKALKAVADAAGAESVKATANAMLKNVRHQLSSAKAAAES